MGYYGKLEEKLLAQNLRKQGYSYREIQSKVDVSKDTLSRWCRNIVLTSDQLIILNQKRKDGGMKGSLVGSKKQQTKRIEGTIQIYTLGMNEVGLLTRRDRFIAGVALYLAEGTKADRVCEFANSDPHVIKFMTDWFVEFCGIKLENLRGALWLHEGLSEEKAKLFWKNLTGISKFHKTYISENKVNSNKIRKNIHSYGVFSIRFSNAAVHRKIIGWIAGLLGEAWYNNRTAILRNPS